MARKKAPVYAEGTHAIENGLYVRKRGSMASYFVRVQKDGKRHDIGLGSVGTMSEDEARQKAMEVRVDVARGATPWVKEKKEKAPPTFEEFFPDAFRRYSDACAWKNRRTMADRRSLLERFVMPCLKEIRVDEISVSDVVSLLTPVWKDSAMKGDLVRMVLFEILSRAVADGYLDSNPASWETLRLHMPSRKRTPAKHHAALSMETCRYLLPEFMLSDSASSRAVVMVVFTARRINEVLLTRWQDIDLDAAVWTIPDEHMKVCRGVPRRVPLPCQLVNAMKEWPRQGEFVFSTDGRKPLDRTTVLRVLKTHAIGGTIHGFRSTFIDWCAEHDVPIEVAEKCLDHESGSQVRRAYQRSDLFEQRKDVLQRYADALFSFDNQERRI